MVIADRYTPKKRGYLLLCQPDRLFCQPHLQMDGTIGLVEHSLVALHLRHAMDIALCSHFSVRLRFLPHSARALCPERKHPMACLTDVFPMCRNSG